MTKGHITKTWVIGVALSGALQAHAKMPPNSFLKFSANSQAQLVEQIKKYPEVSDRYERHYAMTQSEVIMYIKSLKLSKLKAQGDYLVYNVPANSGVLRSRLLHLPKGTKVWVDWQGEFVLQWVCGNPMGRGPKVTTNRGEVVADIVGSPAQDLAPVGIPAPGDSDGPLFAANAEPPVPAFSEATPVNPGTLVPVGTSNAPFGLLLLPLLLLRQGGSPDDPNPPPPPPPPVPEPATLLATGMGVATLFVGRRRISPKN